MKKPSRVIVLLVDGVSSLTLEQLLDNGVLPNMAALRKRGSYHGNVVASFPTVSGPAHVPLLMGVMPSTIDLIGHNQFLRTEGRLENYLLHYRLFDRKLKGRRSLYSEYDNSVSVGEPVRVGAHAYRKNIFSLADWAKVRGPANGYVMRTIEHEYRAGRDCIVGWLHETDGLAHRSSRQRNVRDSLASLDRWLGRFVPGLDEGTTLIVTSDHGMEWTTQKPLLVPKIMKAAGYQKDQYVYYTDGGAFCQIYLKKDGSYAQRQSEQDLELLPSALVQYPEIDLILYRRQTNDGDIGVILSSRGRATVKKIHNTYYYRVEQGRDPLGYLTGPSSGMFSTELHQDQCLLATADSDYPDGHYQVFELLMAPSSGDLIFTGARGVSFNILTSHAVHGGLHRSQSVTFILSNKQLTTDESCLRTRDLPRLLGVLD
ncbi:MAG: alkaline phosphatase family protein [bacterium]|nr:alkaline phosphatase family protein [bacterium]